MMAYTICAVGWRTKDFAAAYPQEKAPRRSLREEVYAIEAMLETAANGKNDTSPEAQGAHLEKWQPIIDALTTLKNEGLLDAYALFERVDADLAKDYAGYRAEHRDMLERYIRLYWCGFE